MLSVDQKLYQNYLLLISSSSNWTYRWKWYKFRSCTYRIVLFTVCIYIYICSFLLLIYCFVRSICECTSMRMRWPCDVLFVSYLFVLDVYIYIYMWFPWILSPAYQAEPSSCRAIMNALLIFSRASLVSSDCSICISWWRRCSYSSGVSCKAIE